MANTVIKHVYGNVMKVAIPLTIRIRTLVDGQETETEQDFFPSADYPVYVVLYKGGGLKTIYTATMTDNIATIEDDGTLAIGTYQVEVLCHDNQGNPFRYMVRAIIQVVDATIEAGIQAGIEFNSETYTLNGAVYFYAKGERGVSIISVEQIQTSEESGGANIIRVTLSNGITSDFEVRNGKKVTPTYENEVLTF